MDIVKAILLGVIQGLSEFLPISSSGHLVISEYLMNFNVGGLAFEVFVHFGTLLAVLWVFRKDIFQLMINIPSIFRLKSSSLASDKKYYARLGLYIIIGSIPAAVIGIFFEDAIEQVFESHLIALGMLFITGLIVWSSRYTRETKAELNGWHAFLIGIAQAFAILPGISRSGSTIVTGLWLGIPRDLAARFSFLLSTPVIFGATLLKTKDVVTTPLPNNELWLVIAASLAAMISGYFAIIWLLGIIRKQQLEWFGVYCVIVSVIGFVLHFTIG
jgi:undecaprenyl-diphosphatase